MRIAHIADCHFSMKAEKLEEVVRTTDAILVNLQADPGPPKLIVLAGDTVDEYDGPIRIDSDCARAAIRFVLALADIAPVAIVTGTPSHDRRSPELFRFLKGDNPIYVADKIEMVGLYLAGGTFPDDGNDVTHFEAFDNPLWQRIKPDAVLTFLPSPDKSRVIGTFGGTSKQLTTLAAKECLHDALSYIGELNATVPAGVPKILIGHGMITGSEFSSGVTATGEDLEYSIHDLNLTNTQYKAFGHVHKYQEFPGNIVYAGSPGRLNFGEVEEKGFVKVEIDGNGQVTKEFVKLPARRFAFYECDWDNGGIDKIMDTLAEAEGNCQGADVRFRYTIPEEERHRVNRELIQKMLLDAGARAVKVEVTIIPKIRQRAAGISKLETLADKIRKWGEVTGVEIPDRVLEIAATIEGEDVPELLAKAKLQLHPPVGKAA